MRIFKFAVGALFFLATGCGWTEITLKNGSRVEAKIKCVDETHLYIEGASSTKLAKADIEDIDHPGNGLATVGGVIFGAMSIWAITVGALFAKSGGGDPAGVIGLFLPPIVVGPPAGVIAIAGLIEWGVSRAAADRPCYCLEEENTSKGRNRKRCEKDRVPGSVLESLSILPLDGGGAVLASFKF